MNPSNPTFSKSFIDYYSAKGLVPGVQNDDNLRLFQRRRGLYSHLGIVPRLLQDRKVLEFGPGSGDYALFTASHDPQLIQFVEGSNDCVASIEEKRDSGQFGSCEIGIHLGDILEYEDPELYDVVLCEGTIPGQDDPLAFTRHIAKFVAPGGVLVITNATRLSLLSDVCRRIVLPIFQSHANSEDELIQSLVDHFTPDLDALGNVSRSYSNWVMDIIIHPWHDIQFSIAESIEILSDQFEILGSSPRFLSDWSWYKAIDGDFSGINERALKSYRELELSLLDCRAVPQAFPLETVEEFTQLTNSAYQLHDALLQNPEEKYYEEFLKNIKLLSGLLIERMPDTAKALQDYHQGLSDLLNGKFNTDFGEFCSFWGRGQQYSSYIRVR